MKRDQFKHYAKTAGLGLIAVFMLAFSFLTQQRPIVAAKSTAPPTNTPRALNTPTPSLTAVPILISTAFNTATATVSPTTIPLCSVTPLTSFNFRATIADLSQLPLFSITADTGALTIKAVPDAYNTSRVWDGTNASPSDWPPGTQVTLIVELRLIQNPSDRFDWLKATVRSQAGKTIAGYVAYDQRDANGNIAQQYMTLDNGCSLPSPTPTLVPTVAPTVDPLTWYVICTLRPNEPPPIQVNVRTQPDPNAPVLATLGPGAPVHHVSPDVGHEVSRGNAVYMNIDRWPGQTQPTGWIARQDALGALLTSQRAPNCPIQLGTPLPTATVATVG